LPDQTPEAPDTKRKGGPRQGRSEVVFHTYPKLIFAWPIIVAGFLLGALSLISWVDQEVLAWIWAVTLVVTFLAVGIDQNRNATAIWIAIVAVLWLLGIWLRDAKGITVFGDLFRFFADLDPVYPRPLSFAISIFITVPYAIIFAWVHCKDKWRFTQNAFEHRTWGKVDWSAARTTETVRCSYPDLLEAVLCLAGDLVIYDASGSKVIRRICHVPLLPLVRRRIAGTLPPTTVTDLPFEEAQIDGGAHDAATGA